MQNIPTFKVVSSQTGIASWYGNEFAGRPTSSGEIFNPYDFTAAHRELPFGTLVKVTFLRTGKEILVRINDRGPHIRDRIIDLSQAAAEAIGLKPHGIGEVLLEVLE
jgi:rare lipoprotein A